MTGTTAGALKAAAARQGISLDDYLARLRAGLKWCTFHKDWHPRSVFPRDRSRADGLAAKCVRAYGVVSLRQPLAQRRAHRRVSMRILRGLLAHPNTLPCTDCGHLWSEGERRHEYDHPRGYEGDASLDVEPVCTTCHADRERSRRRG